MDGDIYAQERTCARKRRFFNRSDAKAVARKYDGVKPYLCRYCGVFHLGHRHGAAWER